MAQSYNSTTLIGRLTKDPELKATPTGKKVVSFSLAVDKGYGQEGTNFFDCEAWNQTAEFVAKYMKKGDLTLVDGKLDQQTWKTKEGQNRSAVRVVALSVQSLASNKKEQEDKVPTQEEEQVIETIDPSQIPF